MRKDLTDIEVTSADPTASMPPRGARLPGFIGLKTDPNVVLSELHLMIVGTGSVGAPIATGFSRLQPAALVLVDPGSYKSESLQTQPILPVHVGTEKVITVGEQCKQISPTTRVRAYAESVQALPPTAFAEADLVVLATDNLAAEVAVARQCLHLGTPLVQASVHGATLVAQVRALSHGTAQSPCLVCAFSKAEWKSLDEEALFSCEGYGQASAAQRTSVVPTMSVSFLCSMAADLASVAILRHVLRLGATPLDTVTEYCGYTHKTIASPLVASPSCRGDHTRYSATVSATPLHECTPREIAACAGFQLPQGLGFVVDDYEFVSRSMCRCGRDEQAQRFSLPGQDLPSCPACGQPTFGQPFYIHRPVSGRTLAGLVDRRLDQLGASSVRWAIVRDAERGTLVSGPQNGKAVTT